jgi:large subunit ribosomal protein LP0
MASESEQTRAKKAATIEKLYELLGTHKQILLASFTNVESNQVQLIRKQLRQYKGVLVISKNTLIKKIIKMRTKGIEEDEFKHLAEKYGGIIPELDCLSEKMVEKVALIFCDGSVYELKQKIEANKVPTEARVGAKSPIDYSIPAGPTSLDPSQINFFHALNISTKIVKGQI